MDLSKNESNHHLKLIMYVNSSSVKKKEPNHNHTTGKLNLWHSIQLSKHFAVSIMCFTERTVGGRN